MTVICHRISHLDLNEPEIVNYHINMTTVKLFSIIVQIFIEKRVFYRENKHPQEMLVKTC
jgi:hypothetical protein